MKDRLIDFISTNFNTRVDIIENADMKDHTSFRIGGPCDVALFPHDRESFCTVLGYLNDNSVKHIVIGNGSNVLFADEGYRGVVVFTTKMKSFSFNGDILECDAGTQLTAVSVRAVKEGYDGYAFACGIPGSVGGGIVMNAGAYNGELSQVVERCTVLRNGETVTCSNAEADFSYRHSAFLENGDLVLEAVFRLEKDSPEDIRRREEELLLRRREKQPLEYPSAGSAFKRPKGSFAAKLIDEAGLKGFSVGGAQVSEKHAGFIINRSGATSRDMLTLFREVRDRVEKYSGIRLEPEVRYLSPKGEEAI